MKNQDIKQMKEKVWKNEKQERRVVLTVMGGGMWEVMKLKGTQHCKQKRKKRKKLRKKEKRKGEWFWQW